MLQLFLRRFAPAAALLLLFCASLAQVAVPPLTARVTDLTGTLTQQQRAALEERLAAFEARKGSQIAVLIVPTTQPEEIEQFSIRAAEAWKVGRKGVDDGALLVVALKDRRLRIEVGYGLEGALPDARAKRIIEEYIVPRFKAGDFFGGIDAGVSRIMSVVEGEQLPPPRASPGAAVRGGDSPGLYELLFIGFMLVFVVGGVLRAMFGRFFGSSLIGGIAGFAGWLMLGSLIAGIGVGLVALVLSLMSGASSGRRGHWYPGPWTGGTGSGGMGGWGGGGWSGGGGGGSWGGGGGGFGGGGASGRW
jgi:uncharacterized protein